MEGKGVRARARGLTGVRCNRDEANQAHVIKCNSVQTFHLLQLLHQQPQNKYALVDIIHRSKINIVGTD